MRVIVYIVLMICSVHLFGQEAFNNLEKETEKLFQKEGFNYQDADCDKLLIDSKSYFFKKSPITYFKGYTRVFDEQEVLVVMIPFLPGNKGYNITWVLKKERLYIQNISLIENNGKFERTSKGEIIEKPYKKLKKEEIKKRIEKFTNSKFNKEGLLPAKWVNGEFGLITIKLDNSKKYNNSYGEYLEKNQKHYKMIFKKGKLKLMLLAKKG